MLVAFDNGLTKSSLGKSVKVHAPLLGKVFVMLSFIHSSIRSVKSLSLPVGIILLLSSQGAIAAPSPQAIRSMLNEIGINTRQAPTVQAQSTPPDVVIDTDPQAGSTPTPTSADPRFTCESSNGEYTVMYRPESQSNQAYPWAVPRALGGGWSAAKRCTEISRRLESYRPDGLVELTTGVENNYDTVCVTTQADPSCRIVFTVPPGQDALVTRDRVFQNLLTADSGQTTQGVNTFGDSNGDRPEQLANQVGQILSSLGGKTSSASAIDLRPFLSTADGGTGTQLRRTTNNPGQLNPDIFR